MEHKQTLNSPGSAAGSREPETDDEWETGPALLPEEAAQELAGGVPLCSAISESVLHCETVAFPDNFLA